MSLAVTMLNKALAFANISFEGFELKPVFGPCLSDFSLKCHVARRFLKLWRLKVIY